MIATIVVRNEYHVNQSRDVFHQFNIFIKPPPVVAFQFKFRSERAMRV